MDTILYFSLMNGDLDSIQVIQQAGCVLKQKLNTRNQNLLILSLYQGSTTEPQIEKVVQYLLDNGVDPGETDLTSESNCGIFTRLFS